MFQPCQKACARSKIPSFGLPTSRVLRLHHACTLRHWFDRFNANRDAVAAIYDERFVRMWRFYLAASEQTFRHGQQAVFQLQLSRKIDAVPATRDYLYSHPRHHVTRRATE
ncbi:class I SAM-dependent methyltransferase [Yoonia sp.]|uniref:class I SAM-dependent methyltransferase n=1 Tax=Yoonia sp. TaxID=2212373 RepID=UPI0025D5C135|nr:class I SAM-dependent methyltransferase [Yoonia sp.]